MNRFVNNLDLSQRVNLSDPSYPTLDNPAANLMGHGITMFTKRYREWLPSPKYGDILILTGIKRTKVLQCSSALARLAESSAGRVINSGTTLQ